MHLKKCNKNDIAVKIVGFFKRYCLWDSCQKGLHSIYGVNFRFLCIKSIINLVRLNRKVSKSCETFKVRDFVNTSVNSTIKEVILIFHFGHKIIELNLTLSWNEV